MGGGGYGLVSFHFGRSALIVRNEFRVGNGIYPRAPCLFLHPVTRDVIEAASRESLSFKLRWADCDIGSVDYYVGREGGERPYHQPSGRPIVTINVEGHWSGEGLQLKIFGHCGLPAGWHDDEFEARRGDSYEAIGRIPWNRMLDFFEQSFVDEMRASVGA
jgi:hypothetical protein